MRISETGIFTFPIRISVFVMVYNDVTLFSACCFKHCIFCEADVFGLSLDYISAD